MCSRHCKGLFNGLIGNYLIYFFQPTVKSGIPNLLPDHRFLGYITVMSIITVVCKVVDAALFMGSSAFMYAAILFVNILKNAGFAPIWAWRAVFALFTVIGGFTIVF